MKFMLHIVPTVPASPAERERLRPIAHRTEKIQQMLDEMVELAQLAEELGFAGVIAVIALFAWMLIRAYAIGRQAARLERPFAALLAHGIGIWLGVQTFINIGVNMGVLPTKGLTLPLLSFGGSGIVANCLALAILMRVDFENRRLLRGFTV